MAVCEYAPHFALGTVSNIINLSQGTPSQPSIGTARRVDRSANLWFTELAPGGGFCVVACLQADFCATVVQRISILGNRENPT